MSYTKGVVNFDCLLSRSFRARESLIRRDLTNQRQGAIRVGEPDVGERIRRVNPDRLFEVVNSNLNFRGSYPGKMRMSFEIEPICFSVCGVGSRQLLLGRAR